MLSTPPAFNLSQNQTLQFKSVAKISVGRKSESQSSFPFAIHLSMNHTDSLGAKQLFTPLRFRCQQVFFRGPVGATRWREGDLCLIFKPASRTFLPSGEIPFPAVLSDVASSLARTALCAFSTPPSSIFPQKIEKMFSVHQKGASASCSSVFQPAVCDSTTSLRKSKVFMTFFIRFVYSTDKPNKNIVILHKSQSSGNNRSPAVKSRRVRKEPLPTIRDARPQP